MTDTKDVNAEQMIRLFYDNQEFSIPELKKKFSDMWESVSSLEYLITGFVTHNTVIGGAEFSFRTFRKSDKDWVDCQLPEGELSAGLFSEVVSYPVEKLSEIKQQRVNSFLDMVRKHLRKKLSYQDLMLALSLTKFKEYSYSSTNIKSSDQPIEDLPGIAEKLEQIRSWPEVLYDRALSKMLDVFLVFKIFVVEFSKLDQTQNPT